MPCTLTNTEEIVHVPMDVAEVAPVDNSAPSTAVQHDDAPKLLTSDGERLLITCFMLQDDLNPALSRLLATQACRRPRFLACTHASASQANCTTQHVHSFFSKLKTSVRNYVQRLQKKVWPLAAGHSSATSTLGGKRPRPWRSRHLHSARHTAAAPVATAQRPWRCRLCQRCRYAHTVECTRFDFCQY